MIFPSSFVIWSGILSAAIATFLWRLLGLLLVRKIASEGHLIRWINSVAYAMVAGVMMLVLVYPTGMLSTTSLEDRLLALLFGILVLVITNRLLFSIFFGIITFVVFLKLGPFVNF